MSDVGAGFKPARARMSGDTGSRARIALSGDTRSRAAVPPNRDDSS